MFDDQCQYEWTRSGIQCARDAKYGVWAHDKRITDGTAGPVWIALCGHHAYDVTGIVSVIPIKRKGK